MLSSMTVYMYQGRISEGGQSPPSLRRDEADSVSVPIRASAPKALTFEPWRGIPNFCEEPTNQGEQQRKEVDLDLLAAGQLVVEDAKL